MLARNSFLKVAVIGAVTAVLVFLSAGDAAKSWREKTSSWAIPLFRRANVAANSLKDLLWGPSRRRLEALEEERVRLLVEVARGQEALAENDTLRQALALKQAGEEGVIAARVVGFLRAGRDEFIALDRGTDSGVSVGDVVTDKNGALGGTILATGVGFSRVSLLSSPSRSIDVVVADNLKAIARGNNSRELIIDLVPASAEVKVGDIVRPSLRATGGRRGLIIGEVREAKQAENAVFKSVKALHLFDPASEEVLVLIPR